MTRLLVRVADAAEAALAAAAGFDCVEVRSATFRDADLAVAREIRQAFSGTLRLALDGSVLSDAEIAAAHSIGADELAMAIDAFLSSPPAIAGERPAKLDLVALLDIDADTAEPLGRLRGRIGSITIESGRAARLFDHAGITKFAALADACRANSLSFGFSGGLEAPDIPRLLLLRPDMLGFDTAVRSDHKVDGRLLPHLLDAIRTLVPSDKVPAAMSAGRLTRDTIFVRDFTLALSIGAYSAEERERQRVRVSVEAEIVRPEGVPRDMRDVFSYDVVLETIRVLAVRPHAAFVETLAEEVAASLLTHAAVESVTVTVEKLDVVDAAVGVTINRRRPS